MPAPAKKKKAPASTRKKTRPASAAAGRRGSKSKPAAAVRGRARKSASPKRVASGASRRSPGADYSFLPPLPPPPPGVEPYPGDMAKLDALVQAQGLRGLREDEAAIQLPLEAADLLALAARLEEAGRVRILSFHPLHLIGNGGVDFLGGKILSYIEAFHAHHPKDPGADRKRLAGRFDVPSPILKLALKSLVHEGRLREEDGAFALPSFRPILPPREEKMLEELEQTCFGGDFRAVSLNDVREHFNLAPDRLEAMLARLVERRRIVQGQEGFYLHARWLEDLTARLRARPNRIMTIAEFKALTGLSRKYAIPLLELLDEMGVTRRKGSLREIL
ncbi:MAG: SelB C-terminal domain-containing protein [Acidobacteriota bacterium]|nr:SelB C-terminal domain-containing protein [Acidobacteriota bacterium]